ncbi:MAG: LamG domain-containing protein [Ignavibacterium sp.]|nr:LamG domain-containing protein [Ignavibacterium sp.]
MLSNLDMKKLKRFLSQISSSTSGAVNTVVDWLNITSKPTEFPPESHDHDDLYLNKENTDAFTPDADYEPATKKYVDDNAGGIDINSLTEKTTPVDDDIFVIEDSADSFNKKKLKVSNLPLGGGGGGGVSVTEFNSYQELLDDTTVEDGNFGVVENLMNTIFIKFTDWYALGRKLIWKMTANTKWYLALEDNVNDSSGNGFDATATDVTYVTGKVGVKAGSFNGSTSKGIYLGNVLGGAVITNITIMCWAYLSGTSLKGVFVNVGSEPEGNGYNTRGFGIGVGGTTADNNGNNLIGIYDGVRWMATGRAIGTGWHHIAMTINESSKPALYLDGVQVYTDVGTNPRSLNATTPNAVVGASYNNRFFNGYVDEVIVESRLWTPQEVMEYYNQTL